MSTHGFSLMWSVLAEQGDDVRTASLVLETLSNWEPKKRNRIEDSKIEEAIGACLESSTDQHVQSLAADLLMKWKDLPTEWRIPRKIRVVSAFLSLVSSMTLD